MIKTIKNFLSGKGYAISGWAWTIHLNHGTLTKTIDVKSETIWFREKGKEEFVKLENLPDEVLYEVWNDLTQQLT